MSNDKADRVFGPDASTSVVYEGVGKRIVDSFMHGMNGSVLEERIFR